MAQEEVILQPVQAMPELSALQQAFLIVWVAVFAGSLIWIAYRVWKARRD